MQQKTNYSRLALCAIQGMQEMEECASHGGVEKSLMSLIKLRVSQIRKCEHCNELRINDARERGEIQERLAVLEDWKENDHFSEREKAALALTEAMTYVPKKVEFDKVIEEVGIHFTEQELISITVAVNIVNSWNNLSLSMRAAYGIEE